MKKILGIDPGTSLIGYGIIESRNGILTCLKQGAFTTPKNMPTIERTSLVFDFFSSFIKKEGITHAVVEKLFFSKNVMTAMAVSEIRGVIMLALHKNGVTVREFTPLQIKQAVSSYGRANKAQVQQMVKMILSLPKIPEPDDVADALAAAICGATFADFSEV